MVQAIGVACLGSSEFNNETVHKHNQDEGLGLCQQTTPCRALQAHVYKAAGCPAIDRAKMKPFQD